MPLLFCPTEFAFEWGCIQCGTIKTSQRRNGLVLIRVQSVSFSLTTTKTHSTTCISPDTEMTHCLCMLHYSTTATFCLKKTLLVFSLEGERFLFLVASKAQYLHTSCTSFGQADTAVPLSQKLQCVMHMMLICKYYHESNSCGILSVYVWTSHRCSAVSLDQLSFSLAVLGLRNHQNKPVMGN